MAQTTLTSARLGDEQAFRELTDPYRRELQVHCYRMLGSLTDAEDLLQETMLAAWRGLDRYQERASFRTWLYRIATNRCLNALRDNARRQQAEPVPPFDPPEPTRRDAVTWLQPYPDSLLDGIPGTVPGPEARYDATESVRLAFVAALQRLPPRQVAALVLRDVLGYGTDEVADMLDSSPAAIKGLLQRARAGLDRHCEGSTSTTGQDEVGRRFADAYVAADLGVLIALLTDETWLSMPPAQHEYQGIAAIAAFWAATFRFRGDNPVYLTPTRANRQPAYACYLGSTSDAPAVPGGIFVLTPAGGRLASVTRFHFDGALFPRFGLPTSLAATEALRPRFA